MEKMIELLSVWKELLFRSIESCVTDDQLLVCLEWSHHFKQRYNGWIDDCELQGHYLQLQNSIEIKRQLLTSKPGNLW
jgi:hypothetical protein